ncbi:Uma2 family endonuclease [Arthrospira platensis FACHB-439]|uniref:Uma2 family endonuclease n=1 Tax=Limnospira platensis TaxID=118562 RepID=UPI001685D7A3|nr:Uma2 family endonuclease [Arthrospira platensis FACHB-439]
MVQQVIPETQPTVIYPESDGQPMSDNTQQFRWIVIIKENLEILFSGDENIFVAGDLLWYPVEGNNKIRTAPDVMVACGRPKGDRGSYRQWEEDNIAPQVVFEILSPGNTSKKMAEKLLFYQRYGVDEYYLYDPQSQEITGFLRSENWLESIENMKGWVSPRLQIRFELTETGLEIYRPDGEKFLTPVELDKLRQQERERAEQAELELQQERQRYEKERMKAQQTEIELQEERQRYERLIELLKQQGIDPPQML